MVYLDLIFAAWEYSSPKNAIALCIFSLGGMTSETIEVPFLLRILELK